MTFEAHAPPLVSMRGISKRFGAVQAADGIDLTLNAGDILGFSARTAPARRR